MVHVGDTPFAVTLQDAQWTLTGVVVRLNLHPGAKRAPFADCPCLPRSQALDREVRLHTELAT